MEKTQNRENSKEERTEEYSGTDVSAVPSNTKPGYRVCKTS